MKLLIDTNVVLDVFLKREPFFSASYEIMKLSAQEIHEGFVSATAATNIFYLLRRGLSNTEQAKENMERLLQLVAIADALGEDVHEAVTSNMTDFEDAMVAAIAKRSGMDYIISRNTQDFKGSAVKAVTPQAFLTK